MTIPSFLLISAKFTAQTNSFSAGISYNEYSKLSNMPRNIFLVNMFSKYTKYSKLSNMPRNIFFSPLGRALRPPHTLPSSTRLVSSLSSSPSPPHLLPLPGNQLAFKWFRSNKEDCKVLNKTKHLVTFVTFASLATVQTVWNGDHRPKSSGI